MQITVYDTEMRQVGVIYSWVSLVWREDYRDKGAFQLELQRNENTENIINPWNYCTYDGSDGNTVMVALSKQVEESTILINGYSASYVLSRRIVDHEITSGNAEQTLYSLVNNMSPWPHLKTAEPKGIPDEITRPVLRTNIFDCCADIGVDYDMGFRVVRDGTELVFEVYKPENNPNIKYSDLIGNLGNLVYTVSADDVANVAIVDGTKLDNSVVRATVGDTSAEGAARLEVYVDQTGSSQLKDETESAYLERLKSAGQEKLNELKAVESLNFTQFDNVAKLGDVVNVYISSMDKHFNVRVVSSEIIHQRNRTQKKLTLGNPVSI